ncbi:hypothetical protein Tco_0504727 [Tanacetum coccineum]
MLFRAVQCLIIPRGHYPSLIATPPFISGSCNVLKSPIYSKAVVKATDSDLAAASSEVRLDVIDASPTSIGTQLGETYINRIIAIAQGTPYRRSKTLKHVNYEFLGIDTDATDAHKVMGDTEEASSSSSSTIAFSKLEKTQNFQQIGTCWKNGRTKNIKIMPCLYYLNFLTLP